MIPFLADPDVTVYCGDALDVLGGLAAESVDCIVTSPPYADARSDIGGVAPEHFADWMRPFLTELLRIITPAGSMLLNIGRVFRDYTEQGVPYETLAAAKALGWQHAETLIWHKPNALPLSGPYLVPRHEYVWWLAKNARACYRGIEENRQPHSAESIARYRRKGYIGQRKGGRARKVRPLNENGARPGSVVSVYTGSEKGNPHPAPMPLRLAADLLSLGCPSGGLVLDPFAGSGTTGRAARLLSHRAILIEKDAGYCQLIADRLAQQSLLTEAS